MKKRYLAGLAIGFLAVGCLAGPAQADYRYWTGGTEDENGYQLWQEPANWQGGVMPISGDDVYIGSEDGFFIPKEGYVAYNYSYSGSDSLSNLTVGGDLFAGATLDFVGYGYLPTDYTTIGTSGNGTFILNWGTHVVNQDLTIDGGFPGKSGLYELNSGALSVGNWTYVGKEGIGVFTQNGGLHQTQWALNIGYSRIINLSELPRLGDGTYNLNGGTLEANFEYVGGDDGGKGIFNQTGGVNNAFRQLVIGAGAWNSAAEGTYNLTDGELNAGEIFVGNMATGAFVQDGGSVTVNPTLHETATGDLVIGVEAWATGTYNLNGGALTAANLFVGNSGDGFFNQTDGSVFVGVNPDLTVQEGLHELIVARFEGSTGTYNQSDGTLHAAREIIGDAGYNSPSTGTFNQSGGQHTVHQDLIIGQDPLSTGTFNLDGVDESHVAALHVMGNIILGDEDGTGFFAQSGFSNLTVDYTLAVGAKSESAPNSSGSSRGTFTQTGGSATVGSLSLGSAVGTTGTYNLADGTLESGDAYIGFFGTGYFHQWGGSHTVAGMTSVGTLAPSDNNFYNLYGGSLTTGDLIIGNSATGTFFQGADPSGNGDGGAVTVGNDLILGANNWWATGTYNLEAGTLAVAKNLNVGADGTGTFNFSAGRIDIGSYNDGYPNGALRVGSNGTGTFDQSGGLMLIYGGLVIGENAGSTGTFKLRESDGENNPTLLVVQDAAQYDIYNNLISDGGVIIGKSGIGEFVQEGGEFSPGASITLGQQADGLGTYTMKEGGLHSWWTTNGDEVDPIQFGGPLVVGGAATGREVNGAFQEGGRFIQNGGSVATDIVVGAQAGSTGRYELNDGSVGDILNLGNRGDGQFVQNAGSASFQMMFLGFYTGGIGRYDLNGGDLSMYAGWGVERIGREGTGIFTQYGGTHSVAAALELGSKEGGYGMYSLEGGELLVDGNVHVGGNSYATPTAPGTGNFIQAGGMNVINGDLFLSQDNAGAGSSGGYTLSGGQLDVNGKIIIAGKGTFYQEDGILNVPDTIINNGVFHHDNGELNVGTFSGSGIFIGDMTNDGIVAPGNSPGLLTINGDYTQTEFGTLEIELAGSDPGQFDVLKITGGSAFLDGVLSVYLRDGFDPVIGSVFPFLTAENGVYGGFDVFDLPVWNGKRFVLDYSDANRVSLGVASVPLPPAMWFLGSGLAGMFFMRRRTKTGKA